MPNIHPYFSRLDPERQWLFRLELGVNTILDSTASDILAINAQNVTLPGIAITPVVIPYLNMDVKFAGRATQGDMTVTFLNAYNKDATKVLERWMSKIFDEVTEEMGLVEEYKVDGFLVVLKPNHRVWKQYALRGVFPTTPGDRAYDWTASANTTRSATFSVDKVLPATPR